MRASTEDKELMREALDYLRERYVTERIELREFLTKKHLWVVYQRGQVAYVLREPCAEHKLGWKRFPAMEARDWRIRLVIESPWIIPTEWELNPKIVAQEQKTRRELDKQLADRQALEDRLREMGK